VGLPRPNFGTVTKVFQGFDRGGRLPSVLGREFFRLRVKSERAYTFEDSVIFVRDVERSLEKLDSFSQHLLVWVVLHGLSQEETAKVLRCTRRTVARHLPVALDKLSQILLTENLL
jgi:RNA polymerase sigma factor (sigma-70 family)